MLKVFMLALVAAAVASCGGSDETLVAGAGGGGGGGSSGVASVSVVSSTTQIPSDGSLDATITALVRNASNVAIANVPVTFAADSGGIAVTQPATTDANGRLTATLSTLGDPTVRTITVTATADGVQGTVTVDVVNAVTIGNLTLLTSSPQILSDGSVDATITALVRNSNNNVISGVPVVFSASSGSLSVPSPSQTDANGMVTATLSTAGSPMNRTITITGTTSNQTQTVTVDVVGTTLDLSGPTSLPLGDAGQYSVLLEDAGGTGIGGQSITITSTTGNAISATPLTTAANGQASFTLTAAAGGVDTLTATGFGLVDTHSVTVSADQFAFLAPAANTEIPLGTNEPVQVQWLVGGVPVTDGSVVNFSTTRGTVSAASAMTAAGIASITVSATSAGPAVITATNSAGTSTQRVVEFVATMPTEIELQANPFTVGPQEQSTITAIVRDAAGNLVKNQIVDFTLDDVTGGSISVAQDTTDSQGRAHTFYTASTTTSAANGVVVTATVQGTAITDSVALSVAQRELFMSIGTGNEIFEPNSAQYRVEYAVQVTDSQGNPVQGVSVQANVLSLDYRKGVRNWNGQTWVSVLSTPAPCPDEDINRNGVLDVGEDANGSGSIEAGNVATVTAQGAGGGTFTTDVNGFGLLDVVYPQEFAYWAQVRLQTTTSVGGTEFAQSTNFTLPGLAADFNNQNTAPPGIVSPFGTAATCADPN